MNETLLFSLNALLILTEVSMLYLFADCFFPLRYRKLQTIAAVLAMWWLALFVSLIAHHNIVKYILMICIYAVGIGISFRLPSFFKGLILSLFFLALLVLCDTVCFIGFSIIRGERAYAENSYALYLLYCLIKIAELLILTIIKLIVQCVSKSKAATWQEWGRIAIFPVMSMILVILLIPVYWENESSAVWILLCAVVLLITDILAVTLLNYMEVQQQKIQDYTMLKRTMKQEQDNVAAWMTAYENQRRQTHEFQHQLSAIRGLAAESNEQLLRYIDQLQQNSLSDSLLANTGRAVADAILNQKHAIAQSRGITLETHLDNLEHFLLPDDALTVVLSNLLDNAIEACDKITDSRRKVIRLHMRAAPDVNFLYMENPTAEPVQIQENQVVSRHPEEHGYGLKNVQAILRKYQAVYAFDFKQQEQTFCVSIQLTPTE